MKRSDVLQMAATMCAGVFANPALAMDVNDGYRRQNIIQDIIQTTINAVVNLGIPIDYDDETSE